MRYIKLIKMFLRLLKSKRHLIYIEDKNDKVMLDYNMNIEGIMYINGDFKTCFELEEIKKELNIS